jgi:hypothetical protein
MCVSTQEPLLTSSWCVAVKPRPGGSPPSVAAATLWRLPTAVSVCPIRTDCTSRRNSRSAGQTAAPHSHSSFRDTV